MRSGFGFDLRYERHHEDVLRIVAAFTPDPDSHHGAPGFLHGGAAATLLDQTMAAWSWMLDHRRVVTGTLALRYPDLVRLDGRPLRIEAWRLDARPRRAQRVLGSITDADGRACVTAEALFVWAPFDGAERQ